MIPIVGTKITIGGLAGTGKGTISTLLAKELSYDLNSAGNYFRQIAKGLGIKNRELETITMSNPAHDRDIDKRTWVYGATHNHFIFEGRIAWFCIPDAVKILLVCGWNERIKRIAARDKVSLSEARRLTKHRERSAQRRYLGLYSIANIESAVHYHLIVDTTATTPTDNVADILEYLRAKELYKPR